MTERERDGRKRPIRERRVIVGEPFCVVTRLFTGMNVFAFLNEHIRGEFILEAHLRPLFQLEHHRGCPAASVMPGDHDVDSPAAEWQVVLKRDAGGMGCLARDAGSFQGAGRPDGHADVGTAKRSNRTREGGERSLPTSYFGSPGEISVKLHKLAGHVAGQRTALSLPDELRKRTLPEIHEQTPPMRQPRSTNPGAADLKSGRC